MPLENKIINELEYNQLLLNDWLEYDVKYYIQQKIINNEPLKYTKLMTIPKRKHTIETNPRPKKLIKLDRLENKIDTLKTHNDQLKVKVAVLETEVIQAAEKEERNRQRMLELEVKLALIQQQILDK